MVAIVQSPNEPSVADGLDIRDLDALTDEALDQLPFGIIGLHKSGQIFRYNLAEARLARLDRNQVLGLNFFRQVAPCTATEEFEGRFAAFAAAPSTKPLRFSYIFDFKFGAQEVDVEVVQGRDADRFYLCVNRTRFAARRPEAPDETLAPLQAELAPDEAAFGILRDAGARRSVMASPVFFESLRHTWDKMAPQAWGLFCMEWGTKWGRLAVVDLETEVLEAENATLRDLPMSRAVQFISDYLVRHGWGRLVVDFSPAKDAGTFILELQRNGLAEAVGASDVPRCALLSGLLRALFSHLAMKVIVVDEVCCKSQGFDSCRFVAVSDRRKEELASAMRANESDVEAVVDALRGAARG